LLLILNNYHKHFLCQLIYAELGEMKKFFLILSVFICVMGINCSYAAQESKILVIPVDNRSKVLSVNIYPDLLNVVSADAVDAIGTIDGLSTVNIETIDKTIDSASLRKGYNRFLEDYKNYYTIDSLFLRKLALLTGTNKILLISGGFDTQKTFTKRNFFSYIQIPGIKSFTPSYKLVLSCTMIEAANGSTIWQKNYSKDFAANNFSVPSQFMGENVIFAQKIRTFSKKTAKKAAKNIADLEINQLDNKAVNGKLVPLGSDNSYTTRDGNLTKDGHFSFLGFIKNKIR